MIRNTESDTSVTNIPNPIQVSTPWDRASARSIARRRLSVECYKFPPTSEPSAMPIRNSLLVAFAATAVLVPTTAQISVASDLIHEDLPRSWAELANPLPRATDNAKADTKADIDANKRYAIA